MAQHYQSKHMAKSGKEAKPYRASAPSRAIDIHAVDSHTDDTRAVDPRADDTRAGEARCSDQPKRRTGVVILIVILILAVLGGGVFALMHFGVISFPASDATEAPTDSFVIPTLTPTPSIVPTEAPTEPSFEAMAEQTLSRMSDRDKFLQLIIATPEVLTGVDAVNMAGETTRQALADYPVGGIIYSDTNFEDTEQTKELLAKSQSFAKIPMFLAVDEEGGDVARVASKLGTTSFENMFTYKDEGTEKAHDNAETIAADLKSLGFNLDFAPVADVFSNPENTVIGERAYSDDYEQAAQLVASAVEGFHDGGVLCTLKHFPGHGGTSEDSHESLAYLDKTAEEITAAELLPFKSGIDAGADMVMAGHIVVPYLDEDIPATLSPSAVPFLLRGQYRYEGVVITDSMQMAAITDNYSHDEIVKGIFDAEIDMILMPDDLDSYIDSFEKLLAEGSITREQLDRKVIRVLALKYKSGIIPSVTSDKAAETPTVALADAPTEVASLPEEELTPAA